MRNYWISVRQLSFLLDGIAQHFFFIWGFAAETLHYAARAMGGVKLRQKKREELESKSSHKSDIWPPAASKKWGEIYWKYIFQTLEAIFPYKGVFFTKVVKANIIAFIKTNILRPALSVKNPHSKNVSPRCIVHCLRHNMSRYLNSFNHLYDLAKSSAGQLFRIYIQADLKFAKKFTRPYFWTKILQTKNACIWIIFSITINQRKCTDISNLVLFCVKCEITKYLGVCYTIKQNMQKLHCFLEKLIQLARILLDRRSRRWQISILKTSSKIFAQEDEIRPSSELPHRKLNIQTKTTDLYFNARVASVKWKNGRISIHMCTYMYLPEEIFAKPKSKENN